MLPIIIAAYNRPESLKRLLKSIVEAHFPENPKIELIFSLDLEPSGVCKAVAESIDWPFGEKIIIAHESHLGLVKNITFCGNLAAEYNGAIILEDDLLVAPGFYDFAEKALDHYETENRIAGISLYSYNFTETKSLPFAPIKSEFDTYFVQVAGSWGQVWNKNQWTNFQDWWQQNPVLTSSPKTPTHLLHWGEHSWKKYYNQYLIDTGKYFVFPFDSFSTNFEDEGTNATTKGLYQVPLSNKTQQSLLFDKLESSENRFDGWFELESKCLKRLPSNIDPSQLIVDLYGSKPLTGNPNQLWLTSKSSLKPISSWSNELYPIQANIQFGIDGKSIVLTAEKDLPGEVLSDEIFFRTRSFRSKKTPSQLPIQIFIPVKPGIESELNISLNSIEAQELKHVKIYLIGENLEQFKGELSSSLELIFIHSSRKKLAELIGELSPKNEDSIGLALSPGQKLFKESLLHFRQIFSTYNDVRCIVAFSTEKSGFIRISKLMDWLKLDANTRANLDFILAFHSNWKHLRQAPYLEKIDKKSIYLLANSWSKTVTSGVPLISDFENLRVGLVASILSFTYNLISRFTRSPWPHQLFKIMHQLPDTLRYDAKHESWYKERF